MLVVVVVVVLMVDQVRRPQVEGDQRAPRELAFSRYGPAPGRMGSTRRQTSLGLPMPPYAAGRCPKLPPSPNFLSV